MVNLAQRLSLQMKQSPQQVLLSSLLQLPVLSLEQRIRMELETNPLLEQEMEEEMSQDQELDEEPVEIQELQQDEDKDEIEIQFEKEEQEIDWDTILNDEDNYEWRAPKDNSAEVYEKPEVFQSTLTDHLLSQLNMIELSLEDLDLGEYIIWNINNVGYLALDVETIAENFDRNVDDVERVLEIIQHFDPPGIAARNLQECLLIQLHDKEEPSELTIAIVRDHFEDFKNKRFEKIAKKMGLTLEKIRELLEEITKLNPKPGGGFLVINENYVVPDLAVERDDEEKDKFKITLNDWNIPHLRINNRYRKLLLDKKNTPRETRDYIKQRLESARWLINSIHQRRMTILRVMETIVDKQLQFFDEGPSFLRPMILKDVADEIGMDISTVSRVTNGKYVQTEYGVFELKHFFSEKIKVEGGEDVSNKKIKAIIKGIIEKEESKRPLNDQKIAEMLRDKGYNVARRTVAKYREQMMIPVSRLRRKI